MLVPRDPYRVLPIGPEPPSHAMSEINHNASQLSLHLLTAAVADTIPTIAVT